jgi:hypothetical protein
MTVVVGFESFHLAHAELKGVSYLGHGDTASFADFLQASAWHYRFLGPDFLKRKTVFLRIGRELDLITHS